MIGDEDTIRDDALDGTIEKRSARPFEATNKRAVLRELESSPDSMRRILVREGLYVGDVLRWREQDARGALCVLMPSVRASCRDHRGSAPSLSLSQRRTNAFHFTNDHHRNRPSYGGVRRRAGESDDTSCGHLGPASSAGSSSGIIASAFAGAIICSA